MSVIELRTIYPCGQVLQLQFMRANICHQLCHKQYTQSTVSPELQGTASLDNDSCLLIAHFVPLCTT